MGGGGGQAPAAVEAATGAKAAATPLRGDASASPACRPSFAGLRCCWARAGGGAAAAARAGPPVTGTAGAAAPPSLAGLDELWRSSTLDGLDADGS
jgi:hypothetical protein